MASANRSRLKPTHPHATLHRWPISTTAVINTCFLTPNWCRELLETFAPPGVSGLLDYTTCGWKA